jgi:hypothetical protein
MLPLRYRYDVLVVQLIDGTGAQMSPFVSQSICLHLSPFVSRVLETNLSPRRQIETRRQIEEGERTGRTPPKSKIAKNILASAVQNRQKYFRERRAVS